MLPAGSIEKFNQPAPRYTSYPTAPEWGPIDPQGYLKKLSSMAIEQVPLSLYLHIPFCKTMCLYCACSVILNRKPENESRYVNALCQEIQLVAHHLKSKKKTAQIHFGGGTPTKLSTVLLEQLFSAIDNSFAIDSEGEISIEIDPRTVVEDEGQKLAFLKKIGFNRVSFGVQDTDLQVQAAVKRYQSLEMTQQTYLLARQLGFKGINIDLIYGLPHQTPTSFHQTVDHILEMAPDRISLFSYAKVPWLKPHQKAIKDNTLPTTEEKFQIYLNARNRFVENGYVAIGMDHFAKADDELALAYKEKRLQRNFQGYSLKLAEDLLPFGVTSIGYIQGMYIQNLKELANYYTALDKQELPIYRGKILSEEDHLRKWVIHTLMCNFELDKAQFEARFKKTFDTHFSALAEKFLQHQREGLILNTKEKLLITPLGELFVRLIAMTFDAYQKPTPLPKFSHSI